VGALGLVLGEGALSVWVSDWLCYS
jgi:hypothetical protein